MGTITENILASKAGLKEVKAGEVITTKVDLLMVNDITGPLAAKEFEKLETKVWDQNKAVVVFSHFIPAKDIKTANNCAYMRSFAKKYGVRLFEAESGGIEHSLLPELGIARPGMNIIGADSHSCTYGGLGAFSTGVGSTEAAAVMATGEIWLRVPETMLFKVSGKLGKNVYSKDIILHAITMVGCDGALYKAMEWQGNTIRSLSIDSRLTLTNMAIEAGGKSGIVAPDKKTVKYVQEKTTEPFQLFKSDKDAEYAEVYDIDASKLEPQVAFPFSPDKAKPVSEAQGIEVDQVFIGSCTNARYEDLKIVAQFLKGRHIKPGLRVIVIPATQNIYNKALKTGLLRIFAEAGCTISVPTCGACLGGHMGIVGENEVCLSTTNRNFVGRMGHPTAKVYLASPAVAAATAITGKITDPRTIA